MAAITLLGTRLISSPDIGYHLDYGYRFFNTFHAVDSSPHLYTVTDPPVSASEQLPPCAWRDHKGHYRFPNANWLTQVLFASIYAGWGFSGLSILGAVLVLTAAGFTVAAMNRTGIAPAWTAAGILLTALCAFERFSLRPEMTAFALLSAQFYLLVILGRADQNRGRLVAVSTLLHLIFVNAHSYWILGLFLTTAFSIDSILRRLFPGGARPSPAPSDPYLLLLILQGLATFINPWSWRLALLPIKTGLFFLENRIASSHITGHPWARFFTENTHPWSIISEFAPSLHSGFISSPATWAFIGLLLLSATGLVAGAARKEWWAVILITGLAWFSLTMRRNIAPAAFILTPVSLMMLSPSRKRPFPEKAFMPGLFYRGLSFFIILAGVWLIWAVISNNLYAGSGTPYRFGLGPSRVNLPLGACEFLSRTKPAGRIWTDYTCSSNVRFFTDPQPDLPILTNTWAMPVSVMQEVFDITSGRTSLDQAYTRYHFQIAVLKIDPTTTISFPGTDMVPIARTMSMAPRWDLVYIGVEHAVFVRNTGENRDFTGKYGLDMNDRWLAGHIKKLKAADPVSITGLMTGAFTLKALGYDEAFATVYEAACENEDK